MSEKMTAICSAICGIALLILIAAAGQMSKEHNALKREAVARGFAEWVVNQETLSVEFQWKGAAK